MARTFYVDLQSTASATIKVEFSDERLKEIAADLGYENPADLTAEDLREFVEEDALQDAPAVCASCTGYGSHDRFSMDIGEWEVSEDIDHENPRYAFKAVREQDAR